MTSRRSFLGSILALGVAPAIVRSDSLMRIVPRDFLVDLPHRVTLSYQYVQWDPLSDSYLIPIHNNSILGRVLDGREVFAFDGKNYVRG